MCVFLVGAKRQVSCCGEAVDVRLSGRSSRSSEYIVFVARFPGLCRCDFMNKNRRKKHSKTAKNTFMVNVCRYANGVRLSFACGGFASEQVVACIYKYFFQHHSDVRRLCAAALCMCVCMEIRFIFNLHKPGIAASSSYVHADGVACASREASKATSELFADKLDVIRFRSQLVGFVMTKLLDVE